jgi:isopentenyl diphosphate isomerase/L-lactate dehydrogenase-like FMN-dependent dehydrogenase
VGRSAALPLLLSPTGLAGFFWRNGEVCAAKAAARLDLPFCLSTNSIASLEEVAAAVPDGDRWFQLYFLRDREWMDQLVRRAARAGYRVLCLTVDLPLTGRRERDFRNGFSLPLRPSLRNVLDIARHPRWALDALRSSHDFGNFSNGSAAFTTVAQHVASLFDPSADWDTVAHIRELWKGPLVIKGILHPADAIRAVELGCDAVIVSNHGGRQLDHSPAALTALQAVVQAVGDRTEIILDGGVRRGTDVIKAMALGASSVSSGRAFLWGLAAGGEPGVERAIDILRDELDNAMALVGVDQLANVTYDHVRHRAQFGGPR